MYQVIYVLILWPKLMFFPTIVNPSKEDQRCIYDVFSHGDSMNPPSVCDSSCYVVKLTRKCIVTNRPWTGTIRSYQR